MHVALVYPNLPPKLDGIGDFTNCLANTLGRQHRITILTGEGDFDTSDSFDIQRLYSTRDTASFNKLLQWVHTEKPDVLLVQYNPFSYGRRGYNPHLPQVIRRIRKEVPTVRLVLMAHEAYVTTENLRTAIMAAYQKRQFRSLVGSVHLVLSSSETWANRIRENYSPSKVSTFNVGSNIPRANFTSEAAKNQLGIPSDRLVLGFFGTAHPSRPFTWLATSLHQVREAGHNAILLYVGPHGEKLRNAFGAAGVDTAHLHDAGKLPPVEVSWAFSTMDIYLCPFTDGASTRRTTLVTGLQHGVATLSTHGQNTGQLLKSHNNQSLVLSPVDNEQSFLNAAVKLANDPSERIRLGNNGKDLYDQHFDWPIIADRLTEVILSS